MLTPKSILMVVFKVWAYIFNSISVFKRNLETPLMGNGLFTRKLLTWRAGFVCTEHLVTYYMFRLIS